MTALERFRTRWRRWLGNKTRRDAATWTTLLDSNWIGWAYTVLNDGRHLSLLAASRETVKALWSEAITKADMAQLRKLDGLYANEKLERLLRSRK